MPVRRIEGLGFFFTVGSFLNSTGTAQFISPPSFEIKSNKINYVGDFKYEYARDKSGSGITTDYFDNEDNTMADALIQIPQLAEYEMVSVFDKKP